MKNYLKDFWDYFKNIIPTIGKVGDTALNGPKKFDIDELIALEENRRTDRVIISGLVKLDRQNKLNDLSEKTRDHINKYMSELYFTLYTERNKFDKGNYITATIKSYKAEYPTIENDLNYPIIRWIEVHSIFGKEIIEYPESKLPFNIFYDGTDNDECESKRKASIFK
jgi:hypothetical protein